MSGDTTKQNFHSNLDFLYHKFPGVSPQTIQKSNTSEQKSLNYIYDAASYVSLRSYVTTLKNHIQFWLDNIKER
jgi:hypothetical protein